MRGIDADCLLFCAAEKLSQHEATGNYSLLVEADRLLNAIGIHSTEESAPLTAQGDTDASN